MHCNTVQLVNPLVIIQNYGNIIHMSLLLPVGFSRSQYSNEQAIICTKNSHFLPLNGWHIWHNFAHSFPRVWSGLTPKICFVPWKRKMCHEKMWQNINHISPTTYVVYKITKITVTPSILIKLRWNFEYILQTLPHKQV